MTIVKKLILCVLLIWAAAYVSLQSIRPSNDRDWALDQAVLPYAEFNDNLVTVHNIRNFTYASTTSYTPAYYDKTFDLNKIKNVYFIVEPFAGFVGAAHTLMSFEFEGDNFVAISVEIRKEKGETFSALKGLFRQFELMYVVADERDVVKLRSNYRNDNVYVYPVKTTEENARALFVDMLTRANKLREEPEFYNTLTSTCITNITDHVNAISPKKVPFSMDILFPRESDRLAYELGLIDTELPFEKAREKFLINERAEKYANDPNFSRRIRQ